MVPGESLDNGLSVWLSALGLGTSCSFAGAVAIAQSADHNPAAAQVLYEEARRLVADRKFAEACPKFKESYRLDPGGGTLLNLADCYEEQGKTALAWSTFKDALVAAQRDGRSDRVEFANAHIGPLEARMARLTVHVAPDRRVKGLWSRSMGRCWPNQHGMWRCRSTRASTR